MSTVSLQERLVDSFEEPVTVYGAMRAIGLTAFVSVLLVVTLFPLYWTVNTSLKPADETVPSPPTFVPENPTLDGYVNVLFESDALSALLNSTVVSVGATLLALLIGVPAGYAYARNAGKVGGKHTAFWVLSIRMFPPIAPILPLFFLFRQLGLVDTFPAMILLYLTFNVPLVVWLMRSFFQDIPQAVEEAALIDGYSRFQAFYKVALPLVTPGLVATTLLVWVFSWNEFQFALVFARDSVQTYPPLIPTLVGGHATLWNQIAALSTLAMLPVIAISLLMQRRLIRGLTLGAVKG
ncbi:carbohydrate ABC transporter permease [Halobacteriales archaeon SW_12_71_31]|nr:MAG: carbohydrate ABC transporter permease [Halobacteriales archaeon SW_12_71_31]